MVSLHNNTTVPRTALYIYPCQSHIALCSAAGPVKSSLLLPQSGKKCLFRQNSGFCFIFQALPLTPCQDKLVPDARADEASPERWSLLSMVTGSHCQGRYQVSLTAVRPTSPAVRPRLFFPCHTMKVTALAKHWLLHALLPPSSFPG